MALIQNLLTKVGLSKGEVEVYLAGLKLGPSPASRIANEAKINRVMIYHLLKGLENKGLVSKTGPKHGAIFSMEPVAKLKSILGRKVKEMEKVGELFDEVSVEFESIYSPQVKPARIRFYEGLEGLKNIAQETLEAKEILAVVPIENIFEIFDKPFLKYWWAEREKRGIKSKSIWSSIVGNDFSHKELQERRVLPKDANISTTVLVYDHKVAIFSSPKQLFSFVVESEEFAQTMRCMFESMWKKSQPEK